MWFKKLKNIKKTFVPFVVKTFLKNYVFYRKAKRLLPTKQIYVSM